MSTLHSMLRRASLALLLAGATASATAAAAFTPTIDEFWITKGAAGAPLTEIFRDSFNDGVLPPSGPDGASTYNVFGAGGVTGEANGRLQMTPSLGDPVVITTTFADVATSITRQRATNPANPDFLGQASAFEIHGLFDLSSLPTEAGQGFGIRAIDRALALGNEGNNTYYLLIGVNAITGDRTLALRLADFANNTSTFIDGVSIESLLPGADQVEFIFTKAAGSDALTASYKLFDYQKANPVIAAGVLGSGSVLRIYDGESYIRAEAHASDTIPVIPEPATWTMMVLGLASLALVRRRISRRP